MDKLVISIARDFSKTPGSRYIIEGEFSGEEFRTQYLSTKFKEALEKGIKLYVDLDGTIGYGTSFLEEVFGGLAREFGVDAVNQTIEFKSVEEPYLIEDVKEYIKHAQG